MSVTNPSAIVVRYSKRESYGLSYGCYVTPPPPVVNASALGELIPSPRKYILPAKTYIYDKVFVAI